MEFVGIYNIGLFRSIVDTFEAKSPDEARRKASKRAARHEASVKLVTEAQVAPDVMPGPSMYRQKRKSTRKGGR